LAGAAKGTLGFVFERWLINKKEYPFTLFPVFWPADTQITMKELRSL
jgi:hypothetical protein